MHAADIIVGRYTIGKTLKCVRAHELITVATGSSHTPPSNFSFPYYPVGYML